MNDLNYKDVYKKDKVVLFSEVRKTRHFPFIWYNGNNYSEIVNFIHLFSPNTEIWSENKLRPGVLYSINARNFQFISIQDFYVRSVIASLPDIVLEQELNNVASLALSYEEAIKYLRESPTHCVFPYKDISSSYICNASYNFKVYNQKHPMGMDCLLPEKYTEWYIGKDNENFIFRDNPRCRYTVCPEWEFHLVRFELDAHSIVEEIERKKYEINQMLFIRAEDLMFNVGWENFKRRQIMATKSVNDSLFRDFIQTLYNVFFEETKKGKDNKMRLGKYSSIDINGINIVDVIGELRNSFGHSNESYSSQKITVSKIYQHYLKHNQGPQCGDDFYKLQVLLLQDCNEFLDKIHLDISNKRKICGIISAMNDGVMRYLCCGNCILPGYFSKYVGLNCHISKVQKNKNSYSFTAFPYYTDTIDYISVSVTSKIYDERGDCCCFVASNKMLLPKELSERIGQDIYVTEILPYNKNLQQNTHYEGRVLKFKTQDEAWINKGEIGSVEITDGYMHIRNVLLDQSHVYQNGGEKVKIGDKVKIIEIYNNKKIVKSPHRYPFWCRFERVLS